MGRQRNPPRDAAPAAPKERCPAHRESHPRGDRHSVGRSSSVDNILDCILPRQFNDSQFYEIDLLRDFVHTGYIPTVERVFSFLMQTTLQTTQPSLSACLKLAAPLDASMSAQGSTSKHSSVRDGTRAEHAQLRQMLEVMFRNRQYHVSNYPHCPLHAR